MKTYESGILRPFVSLFRGLGWIAFLVAGFLGMVSFGALDRGPWGADLLLLQLKNPLFLALASMTGLIGIPWTLSVFAAARGSYRLHATELEIRGGWMGRTMQTVSLADLTNIRLSAGPLMRLLGRDDLLLTGAGIHCTLYGVKDGEALRTLLLDRRDSLRELKAEEDAARERDSRDALLARLTKVLERLEAKS